jgi:hypothetical protein
LSSSLLCALCREPQPYRHSCYEPHSPTDLYSSYVDSFKQVLWASIRSGGGRKQFYSLLSPAFGPQPYLHRCRDPFGRSCLSKFRLSSHSLAVETGRWGGLEREDRRCTHCNGKAIEDEQHFLFDCPSLSDLRSDPLFSSLFALVPRHPKTLLETCTSYDTLTHFLVRAMKVHTSATIHC